MISCQLFYVISDSCETDVFIVQRVSITYEKMCRKCVFSKGRVSVL